jgi:hypothetical protein
MPTEPWYVVAVVFGNFDQYFSGGALHFDPVDGDGD